MQLVGSFEENGTEQNQVALFDRLLSKWQRLFGVSLMNQGHGFNSRP